MKLVATISLLFAAQVADSATLCPDGKFPAAGQRKLCPDGSYITVPKCALAPDGNWVPDYGRGTRLIPDGRYIPETGSMVFCPDGRDYPDTGGRLLPDSKYGGTK